MAVDSHSKETFLPRVSDFYPRLFSRSWLAFLFSEIAVVALLVAIFTITIKWVGIEMELMILIFSLVIIQSVVGYILLLHALKPTNVILRALAQTSGEASTLPPPDRSNPKFKSSGLDHVLDTIYSPVSAGSGERTAVTDDDLRIRMLEALPVGIIAMNSNNQVIAKNSLAPIYVGEDKKVHVQLNFSSVSDSISDWLSSVSKDQISASKIWPRISDVAPGENPDRRIFDVIAHYKKNAPSGIETIIVTVDRTEEYSDEESNLDFIALAAHELRGPVTVIRGYLDILDEQFAGKLNDEQHELIDRLNVSAKRLASYISNILNASRYDHQHLKLSLRETPVEKIIDDIKIDLDLRAKTLNRSLTWQIPHDLPPVAADQSSVDEVISNLVDNAIKYSKEGGTIDIKAGLEDQFVSISVQDHGIGIPDNIASNLFNKFYRSHRSRDNVGGTGLGLYISRAIVESHGGNIEVESKEGVGSTFTFTLPIYASVADKLAADNSNSELIRSSNNEGWIDNHSRVKK